MTWRRLGAALVVLLALGSAVPAAAIETTTFGIQPVASDRLEVELRPGKSASAPFEVWNKGDEPIVLRMSVVPATVGADGNAALEGPAEPVGWARVPGQLSLGPRQRRTIDLRMDAPRRLPQPLPDVAVLVEPAPRPGGITPAVLQRLALVAHLERAGSDLPDLWPWAGVAITAIVAVIAQIVVSRRRPRSGSRSR